MRQGIRIDLEAAATAARIRTPKLLPRLRRRERCGMVREIHKQSAEKRAAGVSSTNAGFEFLRPVDPVGAGDMDSDWGIFWRADYMVRH